MKFVVPLPPNRANARDHFWSVHKKKHAYWASLDLIQAAAHDGFSIPRPPARPLPKARASAVLFVWSLMDAFNAGARLKWLEDWLVTRGYIEDDRIAVLKWENVPEQVVDRRNPRVVLDLEAL